MMKITRFADIVPCAQKLSNKAVVAIAEAQDEHTVEAALAAYEYGIMEPAFIGNTSEINALLEKKGRDPKNFRIISSESTDESVIKAISLINDGGADVLMKGRLQTNELMRQVVKKENGFLNGRLSLVGFYEIPAYHKIFAVSDFGINTYPDLATKKEIVKNAVFAMHRMGVECPKVAVLAAAENVNPKIQDTVDGDALKKMNESGEITGCIIEGPISFDLAADKESAKQKKYDSPVAGDADIFIVPNITCGNVFVKCLTLFAGGITAGNVLGAKVPIVLTSRSATTEDKINSIALASVLSGNV